MTTTTYDQMVKALREANVFIGGLTDIGIRHYYNTIILGMTTHEAKDAEKALQEAAA